ncbi:MULTISPECIES: hypothetical protein [unclassified Ruegeria]|uniref:hypothetical protein n=1 Tax=unclassified Ruegeria TaxID=2625375 RepID=UPI00149301E1|nr:MULTISPECIES: hypothetical protein [unclassified Ruegeria]NOD47816.1 hypothetical protein [Ruegeria sp. HKCCD5849]NOD52800.1 hypothetical protein [Ruegeria sp. HKCCD5851]NOD68946.1 hypothetical protein [Ruegeria sp. HKCCD7303]
MQLSTYALQKIGFEKLEEDEKIEATFCGMYVYAVSGVTFDAGETFSFAFSSEGVSIRFAFGNDLNEMSKKLNDDVMVDDLPKWEEEKKCRPPYLAVLFGPTALHSAEGCYYKRYEGILSTYESFFAAKEDLQRMASEALPKLLTALTCQLSSARPLVSFKQIEYMVFGETNKGERLIDIRFVGNMSASVSTSIDEVDLNAAVDEASNLETELDAKVTRFFSLGMAEDDPLKAFLYYFLALEVAVSKGFKAIDLKSEMDLLVGYEPRLEASLRPFFEDRLIKTKRTPVKYTLRDKFVWCAKVLWRDTTDDDVLEFMAVKGIRDKISHGEISAPTRDDVERVRKLVQHILLQHHRSA